MKYLVAVAVVFAFVAYLRTPPKYSDYDWGYDSGYNVGYDSGDFGSANLTPAEGYFGGAELERSRD